MTDGLDITTSRQNTIIASEPAGGWQTSALPGGLQISGFLAGIGKADGLEGTGYIGQFRWDGGGQRVANNQTSAGQTGLASSLLAFETKCVGGGNSSLCTADSAFNVTNIGIVAHETTPFALVAPDGLWLQHGWVRGGGWPLHFYANPVPSGVCHLSASLDGSSIFDQRDSAQDVTSWTQCHLSGQAAPVIDTSRYSNGKHLLSIEGDDAAGASQTANDGLQIDNVAPTLALSSSTVPDQNVWIGHGATVHASVTAGPSGVGGITCGSGYPGASAVDVPVDGNGVHQVSCYSQNNALNTAGNPAVSPTETYTVKVDEAAPNLSIEASDSADPQKLVADTSDGESGVGSTQWQMRPHAGGDWQNLATHFDGTHLSARFDDSALPPGSYDFRAGSCDQVSNCAASITTMMLPVRAAAVSTIGFTQVDAPARVLKERLRIGGHVRRVRRHGKAVLVRTGGRLVTVRLVVGRGQACARKKVRLGRGTSRTVSACRKVTVKSSPLARVAFDRPVTVQGVLTSAQGAPVAGAPMEIQSAPANGQNQFGSAALVTTDANGQWSAALPAGPSRILRAVYSGSSTVLPVSGQAAVVVPARLQIAISPRRARWGSVIRIYGQLLGGYIPSASKLLRLNVGIGHLGQLVGLPDVQPNGLFVIRWRFNRGRGVVRPWFSVGTLPEAAYAYAPATSPRVIVTVGGPPAKRAGH